MKQEDFERLKAVCEKEGFEIQLGDKDSNITLIYVKKKDPWDGVEFFCFNQCHMKIKLIHDKNHLIYNIKGDSFWKDNCKPSTEQAYVEQLKKEAFERFGKIKEGDFFNLSKIDADWTSKMPIHFLVYKKDDFDYFKKTDTLFFSSVPIYQQGKWAERVKERVKIDPNNYEQITEGMYTALEKDKDKFRHFLASQLEKYLNNEATD